MQMWMASFSGDRGNPVGKSVALHYTQTSAGWTSEYLDANIEIKVHVLSLKGQRLGRVDWYYFMRFGIVVGASCDL
jgi:hypothetical protein